MTRGAIKTLLEGLKEYLTEPTLVIVNDGHRSTPTRKILAQLLDLQGQKIELVAIACGSHKPPTTEELRKILPRNVPDVLVHSAHEPLESYLYLGETSRGTPIYVNQILQSFSQILCINSVTWAVSVR